MLYRPPQAPARAPPARRKILKLDTDFIKKILKVFKDFACLKGGQFDIIYLNELAKYP